MHVAVKENAKTQVLTSKEKWGRSVDRNVVVVEKDVLRFPSLELELCEVRGDWLSLTSCTISHRVSCLQASF